MGLKFIERVFRTIEMIGIMALVQKLLADRYPDWTSVFLFGCGWAVSYYAWSSISEPLYQRAERMSGSDADRQRPIWNSGVFILSVPSIFVVHLLVVAIAEVPFVS